MPLQRAEQTGLLRRPRRPLGSSAFSPFAWSMAATRPPGRKSTRSQRNLGGNYSKEAPSFAPTAHRLVLVLGELVQTTAGAWIIHLPSRCPNGHSLGARSSSATKPASATAAATPHGHAAHAIRRLTGRHSAPLHDPRRASGSADLDQTRLTMAGSRRLGAGRGAEGGPCVAHGSRVPDRCSVTGPASAGCVRRR
jgi:hypothetical protein